MAPPPRRLSSSSSSEFGDDAAAAIDAIIAEASDLVALEHVAALNTAHLSSDCALLPSDLEARFRKLKSFPPTAPKSAPPPPRGPPEEDDVDVSDRGLDPSGTAPISPVDAENSQDATKRSEGGDQDLGFTEREAPKKLRSKPKYDLGSPTSSPFSFGSLKDSPSSPSPSPPKQRCCFGFSPKKVAAAAQRRKGKEADEVIPELTVQALKEEQRKLKKALQQQEKLTREAARMVRRAKQASARMTGAAVDDLLSDLDEELK